MGGADRRLLVVVARVRQLLSQCLQALVAFASSDAGGARGLQQAFVEMLSMEQSQQQQRIASASEKPLWVFRSAWSMSGYSTRRA